MNTISNAASFSNAGPVAQSPVPPAAPDLLAGLSARDGNAAAPVLGAPASLPPSGPAKKIEGVGTIYRQQSDVSERLSVGGVRSTLQLKDGDNQVALAGSNKGRALGNARLVAGNGNNEVTSADGGAFIRLGDGNNTFSGKFTTLNVGDGNNALDVDGAPVTSISVGSGTNTINVRNGKEVGLQLGGGVTELKGDVGGMEVFLGASEKPARLSGLRRGDDLVVNGPGSAEKLTVAGAYAKGASAVDFTIDSGSRRFSFLKHFSRLIPNS